MIRTTLKFPLKSIKLKSPSFSAQQMALIAQEGHKSVIERVTSGLGADDAPMKPLTTRAYALRGPRGNFIRKGPPYQEWKAKHGLSPIRDLVGPGEGGHMLENLSVRYADERSAKIALTSNKARIKALANEKRSPWLWWSEKDQGRVLNYARKVFGANVEIIQETFRRAFRRAA